MIKGKNKQVKSNLLIQFKYQKFLILKLFTIIYCSHITYSFAHSLPSHFADHNHESDPKFDRPYIRVKNKN